MRLKSREILISIIISVFAIVFASLFYCLSNGNTENGGSSAFEFLYSAFIGVFGSAFVVLLIAVFDYGRAKEDTLRSFYTSVYESAHILRGINYFYYDDPKQVLIEAIREYENRPFLKYWSERQIKENPELVQSPEYMQFASNHTGAQRELAQQIRMRIQKRYPGQKVDGSDQWFFDDAEEEIVASIDKVKIIAAQYRSVSKENLRNLSQTFREIGFFTDYFRKNKIKNQMQAELVHPLFMELDTIRNTAWNLPEEDDKDPKHSAMLSIIFTAQDKLFTLDRRLIPGRKTNDKVVEPDQEIVSTDRVTLTRVTTAEREKWDLQVRRKKEKKNGHKKAD